jgi:hypothetical protein
MDRKLELVRQKVRRLELPETATAAAEEVIRAKGMVAKVETLRKEWFNDLLHETMDEEYKLAAADPAGHFLKWIAIRAAHRFHVTFRTLHSVADRYGAEVAHKLYVVTWPQEIAWAQRMRLDRNPFTATKAALFLRETEGAPARTFSAIADIYSEAIMRVGYSESEVQELSAEEIRFASELPEFAPLFQRYAARAYADTLAKMTRDQVERLAARAAADENTERRQFAGEGIARKTMRSPMRRSIAMIRSAIGFGLGANELFMAERAYLKKVASGEIEVEPGMRTADAGFMRLLADRARLRSVLDMEPLPDPAESLDALQIARLDARFIDALPPSFQPLACSKAQLDAWKEDVVYGRRAHPYDPVSDLGFKLLGA